MGWQIKVVVTEEAKDGAGVATAEGLYIHQRAKEGVGQVAIVGTINVECGG